MATIFLYSDHSKNKALQLIENDMNQSYNLAASETEKSPKRPQKYYWEDNHRHRAASQTAEEI